MCVTETDLLEINDMGQSGRNEQFILFALSEYQNILFTRTDVLLNSSTIMETRNVKVSSWFKFLFRSNRRFGDSSLSGCSGLLNFKSHENILHDAKAFNMKGYSSHIPHNLNQDFLRLLVLCEVVRLMI